MRSERMIAKFYCACFETQVVSVLLFFFFLFFNHYLSDLQTNKHEAPHNKVLSLEISSFFTVNFFIFLKFHY